MLKLFEEYIDIRCSPKNLKSEDEQLFRHEYSRQIPATILRVLNNVTIYDNLVFDKKRSFIHYLYQHIRKLSFRQKIKKFFQLSVFPKKIDKAIWITDELSINYFHWLTDALPRLLAGEKHTSGHFVFLPITYAEKVYVVQSLKLLKHEPFFFFAEKNYSVKELLLPGYTAPTGNYNKTIINLLREKFVLETRKMPGKKIYISRQKATRRKIINEDEVMVLFRKYGFEIHFFEDYDFEKQLQLAQETSHIAGLHGAGLTNMLFMCKKSKVLELRNEGDVHNNCYFSLASDLELDYYYLVCAGDNRTTQDANVSVEVNRLEDVIRQMTLN